MERADIRYRLMWCIEGSKLQGKDAAKYLNLKPSYISMVIHPEQWHRCPAAAWKRLYEWFISDCVLEDFKLDRDEKILPEHLKAAGSPGMPKGSKKVNGKWVRPEDLNKGTVDIFNDGEEIKEGDLIPNKTVRLEKGGFVSSVENMHPAYELEGEMTIPHVGVKEVESEFDPTSVFAPDKKFRVGKLTGVIPEGEAAIPKGDYSNVLIHSEKNIKQMEDKVRAPFSVFDDPIKPSMDVLMKLIKDLERQNNLHITITIETVEVEQRITGPSEASTIIYKRKKE